jgi:hypothetical protein
MENGDDNKLFTPLDSWARGAFLLETQFFIDKFHICDILVLVVSFGPENVVSAV